MAATMAASTLCINCCAYGSSVAAACGSGGGRHRDGGHAAGERGRWVSNVDYARDHVVLILQPRGLFRTGHAGHALRENYGSPRPPNRNQQRALEGLA